MRTIAVLGIGRSSHYLLEYLNRKAAQNNWRILACDKVVEEAQNKIAGMENIAAMELDISNVEKLQEIVQGADMVVSLLPPALHASVAKICLQFARHLATASYVSEEMQALHIAAKSKGLVFINEMGLDPGIDHMSAMKAIDSLRETGAIIHGFESYCGGLVREEDCLENPWKYKFSWNPMNVVLAGQGPMSVYRREGKLRYVPWQGVFADSKNLNVSGFGSFDAYPNRDSLSYMPLYGLENADTFIRGTLRRSNFCRAWQVLVSLGFTENTTRLAAEIQTVQQLTAALTGKAQNDSFGAWLLKNNWIDGTLKGHFDFLELDSAVGVVLTEATAAGKLLQWLSEKWKLEKTDRDEVVMVHRFHYTDSSGSKQLESKMRLSGKNSEHTAMAKTVGLPLAMAVEAVMNGEIEAFGVQAPVSAVWYNTVLPKLEQEGIMFEESHL